MTISSLTKNNSMPLLIKVFVVFIDKLACIVKVFYIISPVLFLSVTGTANKIFNGQVFFSFDFSFVE